jgi:UDP-glucose 4-epimerase
VVTGASGFVGGRLVQRLSALPDVEVTALVRQLVPWLPASVQRLGDLDSAESAASCFEGAESVIHLAGPNEVAMARVPDALGAVLALGRAVADGCVLAGIGRVVYLSTIQVYGEALAAGAVVDEACRPEPNSVYGAARLGSEQLLATTAEDGASLAIFRLTNSVGAPADARVDRWTLVVNDLCRQAVLAGEIRLRSSGRQWRDFVALDDVCFVLAEAAAPGSPLGGTYNLGSGSSTTILDVAALVQASARRAGLGDLPVHAAPASGPPEAAYTVAVDRLRAAGSWPATPIGRAVDQVMVFCVANAPALGQLSG